MGRFVSQTMLLYYRGLKVVDAYYDHISAKVVLNLEGNMRVTHTLDEFASFATPEMQSAILAGHYLQGASQHGTNRKTPTPPHNSPPQGSSGSPRRATSGPITAARQAGKTAQSIADANKAAAAGVITLQQYHDMLNRIMVLPLSPPPKRESLERVITSGEVQAYRIWRVTEFGDGTISYLRLISVYRRDVIWHPEKEMKGDIEDYGVHAFKTITGCYRYINDNSYNIATDDFFTMNSNRSQYDFKNDVYAFGKVALWGDAIEHELGWRAERAEIKALLQVGGLNSRANNHVLNYLERVYLGGEPNLQWTIPQSPKPPELDSSLWTGRL